MVLEIFTLHLCQILTLHSQCHRYEPHKYEQNKTGNTDTDYEHINRKKQELPVEP